MLFLLVFYKGNTFLYAQYEKIIGNKSMLRIDCRTGTIVATALARAVSVE